MKLTKVVTFIAVLLSSINLTYSAMAQNHIPAVLIVELATDSLDSASAEFVELQNVSEGWVDLNQWTIEYMPASASGWTKKSELAQWLAPGDRILSATSVNSVEGDALLSSGLARTGGHIRLLDAEGQEIDRLGWGGALEPLITPAEAGIKGQSLKRKVDEDGKFINQADNSQDFLLSDFPTPQRLKIIQTECAVVEEEPEVAELPEIAVIPKSYAKIEITELLVDPKKPATDKDDEFIELFNPNSFSVDIKDYILKTGLNLNYIYKLPSYVLKSQEYLAIFSIDSGLVLSNTAGKASLFDPGESVVSETDEYENAKENKSWSRIGKDWFWSDLPTPHGPNRLQSEEEDEEASGVLTKRISNLVLSESTSDQSETQDGRTVYEEPLLAKKINHGLLVTVGLIALLYAIYEYRNEITNFYKKLGVYFNSWRKNWPKIKRR